MRNQDIYLDFQTNPSLAAALAGTNAGDKKQIEVTVLVKSIDGEGLSGTIVPGSIVPEGYEPEEQDADSNVIAPPSPPPGALTVAPVMVAMGLKKKGGQ